MKPSLEFNPHTRTLYVPTSTDGVLEGTDDNTIIYLHTYEFRGADHVFVGLRHSDTPNSGIFVFRSQTDGMITFFDGLVKALQDAEFTVHYGDTVAPGDAEIFNKLVDNFVGQISMDDLERPWELS